MFRSLNRAELSFSLVSSTHFEQMIEAWLRLGWLEYAGHIDAKDDWEGKSLKFGYSRTRRYRATELFLAKAQRFGIASASIKDHFQLSHRHADVIQLRNKKKMLLAAPREVRLSGERSEVRYLPGSGQTVEQADARL